MPTAIIIGASSGIGREIALQLGAKGFRLGLAARRDALLREISGVIGPEHCVYRVLDLSQPGAALESFRALVGQLGVIDFVYLVAGTGYLNPDLDWELEEATLLVNCLGFAATASASIRLFSVQKRGHLVAITSVASARPSSVAPAYGASKAFDSVYLEALRYRVLRRKLPIRITEIRPGFVATAMLKVEKPVWVISAARAAELTIKAVARGQRVCYVPWRWGLVARIIRWVPDSIYAKFG